MRICVNGSWRDVKGATLADALYELGYGSADVATAVNGVFVAAMSRDGTSLNDNDQLEIVAPMQGG